MDITDITTNDSAHSRYVGLLSGEAGAMDNNTLFGGMRQSPTRKELSGFSWLWFCPVARLNGATHALD